MLPTNKTMEELAEDSIKVMENFLWKQHKEDTAFYPHMKDMWNAAKEEAQTASEKGFPNYDNDGLDVKAYAYKAFFKSLVGEYGENIEHAFCDAYVNEYTFDIFKEMLDGNKSMTGRCFEAAMNWTLQENEALKETMNEIAEDNGDYLLFRNEDNLKETFYSALWDASERLQSPYEVNQSVIEDASKYYPEIFKEIVAEFAEKEPERFKMLTLTFPEMKEYSPKKETDDREL